MAVRYKEGLAARITSIISPNFSNFNQNIDIQAYCDGLEKLFNQDYIGLKKFAFKIFDINQDKKLSENDMFELMKLC